MGLLDGKVCVVTGGAGSVGLASAQAIVREGGKVMIVDLKEADAAMYRAKRQQDVGYAFFDPGLDTHAVRRSRRVLELREAVELGQFTLDYQPVIDLEAHEITGYEALLRWQHPTEGVIGPLEFIPLAEESGLIVPLGKWVLSEACRYGARLNDELGREIRMSVNVSARQLQHGLGRAHRAVAGGPEGA